MENSYLIRMSRFPNLFPLDSGRHSNSLISFRLTSPFVRKAGVFPFEKVRQHKNSSSSKKLEVRLKNKILHCFKRRHCEKLCCERTSQFYICVYIQLRRRRPLTDCILSFLFSAETDVLVPIFSQSTDVVVVNFVVVLKFPNLNDKTGKTELPSRKKITCNTFRLYRFYLVLVST